MGFLFRCELALSFPSIGSSLRLSFGRLSDSIFKSLSPFRTIFTVLPSPGSKSVPFRFNSIFEEVSGEFGGFVASFRRVLCGRGRASLL